MSAVDDYRKFNYVVQFGGHIRAEDVAVVREVFVKMEERADAAIAELQAEVAEWKNAAQQETKVVVHLKAELAELRDRKGR